MDLAGPEDPDDTLLMRPTAAIRFVIFISPTSYAFGQAVIGFSSETERRTRRSRQSDVFLIMASRVAAQPLGSSGETTVATSTKL